MISRLKEYRVQARLSQEALAMLVGFTDGQRRISHYETGSRKPDLNDCRAIVRVLNQVGVPCTLDEVFPPELNMQNALSLDSQVKS